MDRRFIMVSVPHLTISRYQARLMRSIHHPPHAKRRAGKGEGKCDEKYADAVLHGDQVVVFTGSNKV